MINVNKLLKYLEILENSSIKNQKNFTVYDVIWNEEIAIQDTLQLIRQFIKENKR